MADNVLEILVSDVTKPGAPPPGLGVPSGAQPFQASRATPLLNNALALADVTQLAQQRLDREQLAKRVQRAYDRLTGNDEYVDPIDAAVKEKISREKTASLVKAEYLNRTQGPADAIDVAGEARAKAHAELMKLPEAQAYTPPTATEHLSNAAAAAQGLPGSQTLAQFAGYAQQFDAARQVYSDLTRKIPKALPAKPGVPGGAAAEGATGAEASGGAAAEGAEAASAVEAGAAGGPLGLAVAAVVMAAQKVQQMAGDAVRSIGTVAEKGGEVTAAAARGDNALAVGKIAEGMVSLTKAVPIVGQTLGLVADQALKVTKAFIGVVNAFVERGRELSRYNGALATSFAESDVRALLGDIREADALGPGIARLNDAQSELSNELRELLLPVKQGFIEILVPILEEIRNFVVQYRDFPVALKTELQVISEAVTTALGGRPGKALEILSNLKQTIADAIKEAREGGEKPEDFYDRVKGILHDLAPDHGGPNRRLPEIFDRQRVIPPLLLDQGGERRLRGR